MKLEKVRTMIFRPIDWLVTAFWLFVFRDVEQILEEWHEWGRLVRWFLIILFSPLVLLCVLACALMRSGPIKPLQPHA